MISVKEAINIVGTQAKSLGEPELRKVQLTLNYVLFEDVFSPINMPPFRQSAMDGYALNLHESLSYNVTGEVKAGDGHQPVLKIGEAIRIFTGAPVPDSATAVIMQEKTQVENSHLVIDESVMPNANIRPLGEQVHQGDCALKKGTKLTAAGIAYLASLGITEVKVYKKPSVAIVVTGNELAEPGKPLSYGQIYESNATMLQSALQKVGYEDVSVHKVADDYQATLHLLDMVINGHDMVLVSGGISVGDYDFVGEALKELEVKELFYKVKQKPGKPLFFGKKQEKLIFALPGNPAAALSCFYVYVLKALEKRSGNEDFNLTKVKAKSLTTFHKKANRAQFLKATYKNGHVEILEGQNSSMLHTFALANALVYLNETDSLVALNDELNTFLLPIY